jgi:D-glycero-D-manno-heptose 1,7-bisphosphate phosphatase
MTKRAIFLDRDGVINIDHGYVHKKENFEFVDSIFDFCKEASKLEYLIFVVTNQSGIGRGYYTEKEFLDLTHWMQECFIDKAIKIEKVYYCPHHKDAKLKKYKKECFFRKPNPGMINQAIHEYDIDPDQSILIGDNITDVISGMKAGVKNIFLYNNEQSSSPEYIVIKNLKEVIKHL